MSINAKVAKKVRFFLKKKSMTAEKLAYEIGMSKGYLSDFLTGKKGIQIVTLERIAKGLEIKVRDLIPD